MEDEKGACVPTSYTALNFLKSIKKIVYAQKSLPFLLLLINMLYICHDFR